MFQVLKRKNFLKLPNPGYNTTYHLIFSAALSVSFKPPSHFPIVCFFPEKKVKNIAPDTVIIFFLSLLALQVF